MALFSFTVINSCRTNTGDPSDTRLADEMLDGVCSLISLKSRHDRDTPRGTGDVTLFPARSKQHGLTSVLVGNIHLWSRKCEPSGSKFIKSSQETAFYKGEVTKSVSNYSISVHKPRWHYTNHTNTRARLLESLC